MEYLIGSGLSLAAAVIAAYIGFDRERIYYPFMLIVIASYYILFACMGEQATAVILESAVALGFAAVAVMGFRGSLWWVAAALLGHGIFDFGHGQLIDNPTVPAWWPGFCLAFDAIAALALAVTLRRNPNLNSSRA